MIQKLILLITSFLLGACSVFGNPGVEIASYKVLQTDGPYEVRKYDQLVLVETTVAGNYEEMSGEAFNRLFKYISGANVTEQNIKMTAPVISEQNSGQEIAMTAPVIMNESEDNKAWTMAFVLPEDISYDNAPQPANPDVRLRKITDYKVAALRFSGTLNQSLINQKTEELRTWIKLKNLETTGQPQVAGYNPPWTLPWFRRNEILIPVE